ncbi:MAG: nitrophenyl compound nitroreductase subunit ArsF family protein [Myxococcota bacterium]|jgi:hypothetical protein
MNRITDIGLIVLMVLAAGCTKADSGPKDTSEQKQTAQVCAPGSCEEGKPDKIVVYYFHGNRRCKTCMGIQQTIEETIHKRFANERATGFLVYKEVNFEEPANKHYLEEYQLSFSTMVVAAMKGEKRLKYENCEKVWEFSHDQPKLVDYVAERIGEYLKMSGVK